MKFKGKKRLYKQGGAALHNQIPKVGVRAIAPIRNTYATASAGHQANVGVVPRYADRKKTNAEIMAEAKRHQAREQGQQAQDAQAALAQQNRRNAIASNRIQGNVPSVPVTSSFRIPTTQGMRAHANPVRRTGGIPFRNRAVAATNVLVPESG